MQSTMTAEEADPHDIFVIEPDVVLAARADTAPAIPARDAGSAPKVHPLIAEVSGIAAGASVPPVDTTFRAAAVHAPAIDAGKNQGAIPGEIPSQVADPFIAKKPSRGRWAARALIGFLFAICSAMAAATWQHYGDTAKQRAAELIPRLFHALSTPAKTAASEPAAASTTQAATTDQAAATTQNDASPASLAPTADVAAPPASTGIAESSQVQAMARDVAAMGQQIEQLKASIEQLKAGQEKISQQMSRDLVKNTVARLADPAAQPRIAPRPVRKPKPAYTPVQAMPAPLPPPQAAIAPAPLPAPLPAQATSDSGGDPVVRPPMPLR